MVDLLFKKVTPRALKGSFESDDYIDGRILGSSFDLLEKAAADVGFFGQGFLCQSGFGAESAQVLSKNHVRLRLHIFDDA